MTGTLGLGYGAAQAATSAYKKKCDDNKGKCPPMFETLAEQTRANHEANVKAATQLVAERAGSDKAAKLMGVAKIQERPARLWSS